MRLSSEEFRTLNHRAITLLGMSGVGKTRLATLLEPHGWFHYSGDYRIGSRYLDEAILDNLKEQAMQIPFLRDLLRSDSIVIRNNITPDNLAPISSFLGKIGDPERGGIPLAEFKRRQRLHRQAEIEAMRDVPEFIGKARKFYGAQHFINDAGGSLCELDEPEVLELLAEHTVILYIRACEEDEAVLLRRAQHYPKPLYYREAFLEEKLAQYLTEQDLPYAAMIDPDHFVRWVFPHLFRSRLPRYQAIADTYGYTLSSADLSR